MIKSGFFVGALLSISSIAFGQDMTIASCEANGAEVMDFGGAQICMARLRPEGLRSDYWEGQGEGLASCQNPYSKLSCWEVFDVLPGSALEPLLNRLSNQPQNQVLGCAKTYALAADAILGDDQSDGKDIVQGAFFSMRAGVFGYAIMQYENDDGDGASALPMTLEQCSAISTE